MAKIAGAGRGGEHRLPVRMAENSIKNRI